jgi:hypothetical protein
MIDCQIQSSFYLVTKFGYRLRNRHSDVKQIRGGGSYKVLHFYVMYNVATGIYWESSFE